jgi:hypothetical protein
MQQRPNKSELLLAVAQFLQEDVRPTLQNPGLAFRVLIAANLAHTIAAELWAEDALAEGEIERLRALLPDVDVGTRSDLARSAGRREALTRLNRALAERIRSGTLDEEGRARAFRAVMANLRDTLLVSNPRFDAGAEVP